MKVSWYGLFVGTVLSTIVGAAIYGQLAGGEKEDAPKGRILIAQKDGPKDDFAGVVKALPGKHYRGSPPVISPLASIHVKLGQTVKKGDLLLKMQDTPEEPERQEAALEAAKANAESLAIQAKNQDEIADRIVKLGGSIALEEKHRAIYTAARVRADLRKALAQVKLAEKELAVAKVNFEFYSIYSEIDGRVEKIHAALGDVGRSKSNEVVWIEVLDTRVVALEIQVTTAVAKNLKTSSPISVTQDGKVWKGIVHVIGRLANPTTGHVTVTAHVENPTEDLAVHTKVTVTFNK
jgi:multidrug efflux pump subunit AcrA (membrane-fusion protein)